MLKTVEKVLLLQDLREFGRASTEELAKLAAIAQEKRAPAQTLLFAKGERPTDLLLLVEGKVSLEGFEKTPNQVERTALDLFSVLSQAPHICTARTASPCVLLVVPFDDLVDLLETEAEFCWALVIYLATKGREFALGRERQALD